MMLCELVNRDQISGDAGVTISGLTADSRVVRAGDIFAAFPSVSTGGRDGREFVESAIKRGASAVLSLPGLTGLPVPVISSNDPRKTYTQIAAVLYPGQPETLVAVTGTNGKSSTVEFLRQIWAAAGKNAACFGTLGVTTDQGVTPLSHTTPDAVALHRALHNLDIAGVTHVGMEASSHGLKQYRLDGVRLGAVGFTNLTQDHFDYHPDVEDYFLSKARLFSELVKEGLPAVINVDSEYGQRMADIAKKSGLDIISVGWAGNDIRIAEITPRRSGQIAELVISGKRQKIELPLAGEFQALNAVSALGLAVATGIKKEIALASLTHLRGVMGRMEKAGETKGGAPVFVDFAHTPDGLDKLLRGVRPHTVDRIIVVFGCGGDRDPDKRPQMGAVAAKLADHVIVTDDNPRTEVPETIRATVMKGCPDAENIGDRAQAIRHGVALLQSGDCLVIAGKGHENGQIVDDKIIPFRDVEEARKALELLS